MLNEEYLSGRDGLREAIWYLFARVKDTFLMTLMHREAGVKEKQVGE